MFISMWRCRALCLTCWPPESSDSSNGSPRPSDPKAAAFDLPSVPSFTESPNSSAPSTPNEESQGHKRSGSVAISNEDYFVTAIRLRQESKSAPPGAPGTPQGAMKRSASFSPRIVFHDTWPSQEYDRRGEIATCNRLTPMLAQQIKEELNNFKMVRILPTRLLCLELYADASTGDGSSRELQDLHALLLIDEATKR